MEKEVEHLFTPVNKECYYERGKKINVVYRRPKSFHEHLGLWPVNSDQPSL